MKFVFPEELGMSVDDSYTVEAQDTTVYEGGVSPTYKDTGTDD